MEKLGSSGRGANKKVAGGSRRSWISREEADLLNTLKDLVSNGWKSGNGFRTGYLNKVEDSLKLAIPNCDFVVNPRIISKITSRRKHYGSLVSAQHNTTGVGFNTTTNTLEVTDDQWISIVNKDPSMKGMRYREWPLFTDWLEVFGKDRATGEIAEDVLDASNIMRTQYTYPVGVKDVVDNGEEGNNYVKLDPENSPLPSNPVLKDPVENNTTCHEEMKHPSSNTSKKRKNKAESVEPSMAIVLENFCRATNEWRETMASRIGYEKDLGQQRTKVYGLLSDVPGLSLSDKLDATKLIGARNDRLEIFMGLTEEARAGYAFRLLECERTKGDNTSR